MDFDQIFRKYKKMTQVKRWLNFGGDLDHSLDPGIYNRFLGGLRVSIFVRLSVRQHFHFRTLT